MNQQSLVRLNLLITKYSTDKFIQKYDFRTIAKLYELSYLYIKADYCKILVAGTSGKGSTVGIISNILLKHYQTVGTSFSPHIREVSERFLVNFKEPMPELIEKALEYLELVLAKYSTENIKLKYNPPVKFEIYHIFSHLVFSLAKVKYVVYEVGIGGRLDPTNYIKSSYSVITEIGFDHQDYLGDTLAEIATEKFGVAISTSPLISGTINPEIRDYYQELALKNNIRLLQLGRDFFVTKYKYNNGFTQFDYLDKGYELQKLKLNLVGEYQTRNAAIAIKIFTIIAKDFNLKISTKKIRLALRSIYIPARLEIRGKYKNIILNTAHNQQKVSAAVEFLKKRYKSAKFNLVYPATYRAQTLEIFKSLLELNIAKIYLVKEESKTTAKLVEYLNGLGFSNLELINTIELEKKMPDFMEDKEQLYLLLGNAELISTAYN